MAFRLEGGGTAGRGAGSEVVQMLMLMIFVVGAIVVTAPLVATLLVSVASRREDSEWTLGGPARRGSEATARRIVGFHSPAGTRR